MTTEIDDKWCAERGLVLRSHRDDRGRWQGVAVYGPNERHRYLHVWRWADDRLELTVILMNPSTATERQLDPTLRRMTKFAQDWGYGGLRVLNAYALRSTDPKVCLADPERIGPHNDAVIAAELAGANQLVLGWGTKVERSRLYDLRKLVGAAPHLVPCCIRQTAEGHPEHPLYLPATLEPVPWSVPR